MNIDSQWSVSSFHIFTIFTKLNAIQWKRLCLCLAAASTQRQWHPHQFSYMTAHGSSSTNNKDGNARKNRRRKPPEMTLMQKYYGKNGFFCILRANFPLARNPATNGNNKVELTGANEREDANGWLLPVTEWQSRTKRTCNGIFFFGFAFFPFCLVRFVWRWARRFRISLNIIILVIASLCICV